MPSDPRRPHLAPETIRLSHRRRWIIYGVTGLLLASGLAWLAFDSWVRVEGPFGPAKHPLEPWFMKIHGGAAMGMLMLLGSLMPIHVRRAWALDKNRQAGFVLAAIFGVLVTSGYALYYFGGESTRPYLSYAHWLVGVAILPVLGWHVAAGQRSTMGRRTAS